MQLPFVFAQQHQVLLEHGGAQWRVIYTPETPPEALLEVQRQLAPAAIQWQKVDEAAFEALLTQHYAERSQKALESAEDIELAGEQLDQVAAQLNETLDLLSSEDEAPVIRLLNAILADAIRENASDIHIEPFENQLRVRFRIDGQLRTVLTLKPTIAPLLISRVKVLAGLDISEKRLPQDGRIAIRLGGRAVDLRVSTLPASFGERAVLRLLDKSAGRLSLDQLGMPPDVLARFRSLLDRPHGVILVTGPTGSGKTTTLYAALSHLNEAQRNILTIEDPVEYNLPGINQTQVHPKAGLTFAKGLRAMLRQDPDVVMVGEIRDRETADIAIQASLTGHLVLSTLHTNTAIGAVTRLRDMGVEPFLLASGLVGVMAQRLVRRLCPTCKAPYAADAATAAQVGVEPGATLYRPTGCAACHHTGYQGRLGLYELVVIDERLRQMIHDDASELEMADYAHRQASPLEESGWAKVRAGETSVEEVLRVVRS